MSIKPTAALFNQIEVTLRFSNVLHTKAPYASKRSLESA
jgi:hypothetical protein